MNSKERVITALEHNEPDRVPTGEIGIDYPIIERVLARKTFYRTKWKELKALWEGKRNEVVESYKKDIVDLTKKLELDFIPVFLIPFFPLDPLGLKNIIKKPRFIDEYTWEDGDGDIWKFLPGSEGWPTCIKQRELTIDDIQIPLKVEIDESQLELIRYVVKKLGKTHFILGRGVDGTFPWFIGGMENFLAKMVTEPEFIRKTIEASTKRAIEIGKVLIEEGCDGLLLETDYCGDQGPMMSPKHFKEYIYPSLAKHCAEFHKAGAWVIKHTDGNTWQILDMMIETGIDALHGIQTTAGMDIKEMKEKVGNKISLWGAIYSDLLIRGTEEEVAKEIEYDIKYAGLGGGLVITSGNTIQVETKYDNYMAMLRTVKKKGVYPINL